MMNADNVVPWMSRVVEARAYLNFCIKQGVSLDEERINAMSDEELVRYAEEMKDRADGYADSLKYEDEKE